MKSLPRLIRILTRLRSPKGCPWDKEQTPLTLRGELIEECYELVEAITENNPTHIQEEIGDVLLNATMIALMFQEKKQFTIDSVYRQLCEKLIRRHPHVFGTVSVKNSAEVLRNWAAIKATEAGHRPKQGLDRIPLSYPPLLRAYKIQKQAAKAGFDWSSSEGVWNKINEESKEIKEILASGEANREKLTDECGDLLFSMVNLCRKLHVDPVVAMDHANQKFTRRFHYVESKMNEAGIEMNNDRLPQMDAYWDEAKEKEKQSVLF